MDVQVIVTRLKSPGVINEAMNDGEPWATIQAGADDRQGETPHAHIGKRRRVKYEPHTLSSGSGPFNYGETVSHTY